MSEDASEKAKAASSSNNRAQTPRTQIAKALAKERLAAALRENLKRRKAQSSARKDEVLLKQAHQQPEE